MADDRAPEPVEPRRTDTRSPRRSRMAALQVLYAADLRRQPIATVVEEHVIAGLGHSVALGPGDAETQVRSLEDPGVMPLDGFAQALIQGVATDLAAIDARIGRLARGWKVERMPVIDRNVLRLAICELDHQPTPVAVVLDEAVRLVTELSTEASGRFVNGILAAVVRELDPAAAPELVAAADQPLEGPDDPTGMPEHVDPTDLIVLEVPGPDGPGPAEVD
jgi:transcription antitermination protein NusB